MSAVTAKKPVSAKARAADKANLAKARAIQKSTGALHHHTAKQQAASKQNLVKARAVQKARRAGKKPVSAKKAKAPLDLQPELDSRGLITSEWPVHLEPACASVAVAASLAAWGGDPGGRDILELYRMTGPSPIAGVLEAVAAAGLSGWRLAAYERADPDLYLPGLVYGIQIPAGYHAVLTGHGGMHSWGMVLPLAGEPEEAWMLEWEKA